MRFALLKKIAHARSTDPDEHLDEIGTRHGEERTPGFTGNGTREQSFPCAWRTDEKRAFGKASTKLGELLRILQELDDFLELDLRFIGTSDIGERDLRRISGKKLRF